MKLLRLVHRVSDMNQVENKTMYLYEIFKRYIHSKLTLFTINKIITRSTMNRQNDQN